MINIKELDIVIDEYNFSDEKKISIHFNIPEFYVKNLLRIGFKYFFICENNHFSSTSCFQAKYEHGSKKFNFYIYRNDNNDIYLNIYEEGVTWSIHSFTVKCYDKPYQIDLIPLFINLHEFLKNKKIIDTKNFREFTEDLKKII